MPKLLDINEFCKDLKEVTTEKVMNKKKFHPEGLFSEQIFGPLKNYTCQCGTYHGISKSGGTCSICHVDIVSADERRKRFARIVLPIPVINPLFYDLIMSVSKSQLREMIDSLLKNEDKVLYLDTNGELVITNRGSVPSQAQRSWDKLEAVYELIKDSSTKLGQIDRNWRIIKNNIDKLIINYIIVLPPDLRPTTKDIEKSFWRADTINQCYMYILQNKVTMARTAVNVLNSPQLFYAYYSKLQKVVDTLYDFIISKLSKKEGLIRKNILGKRIDFSGRAIITPDPTLNLDECYIPYLVFLEIYKLPIAQKLIEQGRFKLLNEAVDFIDESINSKNLDLFQTCEKMAETEVCLLNRQPSLHRLSMIGFKIKVTMDDVIKIHPLVCSGYNADFDGDQMAVYIPITQEAKQEITDKFLITKNLTNPANGELSTLPSQDIILGVYALTANKFPHLQKKLMYKGEEVTEGIYTFNEYLPKDYPLVNKPVRKKELISILTDVKEKYNEDVTKIVLDNIKQLGFEYATLFGTTLSLASCRIKDHDKIRDKIYEADDMFGQQQLIESKEIENLLKKNFAYSYMVESGARGSWEQVRQIVLTRGFVSNYDCQIVPIPIKNSYLDGLTQREFFTSSYGSRKGLLDVALKTGASGYLSRKLIFTCANLQMSETLDDCETEDTLEVYVNDERKAKMLVYKYHITKDKKLELITPENCVSFVNKLIYVRSPIFCKSPEVCKKCYGDLKNLHSKYIGIIAAQSLGEANTQLILRTFHTSGAAKTKGQTKEDDEDGEMVQKDIVADLSEASNLLHQSGGKHKPHETVAKLFKVYNDKRAIYHVHFECIVAQMMWVGHKKWRLLEVRDTVAPIFYSVQSVPEKENWLLGVGFSDPKKHILQGILYSGEYKGILNKILRGEII